MYPMPKALELLQEVQLPAQWWLDLSLHGGVARRVGWWEKIPGGRMHFYVVVFHDKTRSPVLRGTNPVEEN